MTSKTPVAIRNANEDTRLIPVPAPRVIRIRKADTGRCWRRTWEEEAWCTDGECVTAVVPQKGEHRIPTSTPRESWKDVSFLYYE